MNETGNIEDIRAETVPSMPHHSRGLMAIRTKYGADSAIGHRCSNILEMLQNHAKADGGQATEPNGKYPEADF